MILLIDTSTSICHVTLVDNGRRNDYSWESGRSLAKELLSYLKARLVDKDKTWNDIRGIGVFQGPGSFTGLRIGVTVMNTLADSINIPIVGTQGEKWQLDAIHKLENGQDDKIVLPLYGREANITKPKK